MPAVHYYLGRPARVWISAHSPRDPARQAREGSGRVHSGIPGPPASGFTPSGPAAAHGSADTSRRAGNRTSSATAASGLPSDAAPAGGLLARHRIAIARFGTDVAAAGGIGPALAAGLDPAGYPVVPGGIPEAWERAQVYLGLCERYQELYQAQVAELHLLLVMAPGCSLPLSHPPSLTDPLTNTHTGYRSLIRARRGSPTRTSPPVVHIDSSLSRCQELWEGSGFAAAVFRVPRRVRSRFSGFKGAPWCFFVVALWGDSQSTPAPFQLRSW